MKKILLLLTLAIAFTTTYSQRVRTPFVSVSASFDGKENKTYSLEAGSWGLSSDISISAVFDHVVLFPVDGLKFNADWLGAKIYFTLADRPKTSYMFYFSPKYKFGVLHWNEREKYLLEFGFNPNIKLSQKLLLSFTLSNQIGSFGNDNWNMAMGTGLVYLFKK